MLSGAVSSRSTGSPVGAAENDEKHSSRQRRFIDGVDGSEHTIAPALAATVALQGTFQRLPNERRLSDGGEEGIRFFDAPTARNGIATRLSDMPADTKDIGGHERMESEAPWPLGQSAPLS